MERRRDPLLSILCYLLVICGLGAAALFGLSSALRVPTFHIDGAYQTASGLYRMSIGEFPGRDFFPYLGLGPLYMLFPLFWIFGGDVAASTLAAHLAVALGAGLQLALLFYLVAKPRRGLTAAAVGALGVVVAAVHGAQIPFDLAVFHPGNSLRPLRSLAPFLAAFVVLLLFARPLPGGLRYGLLGATAGVVLNWTNDFGLPGASLLFLLTAALALLSREARLTNAAWFLGAFMVAAAGVLTAATAGYPLGLLRFNLLDVAGDQWWYFGTWMTAARAFVPTDLPRLFDDRVYGCCAFWLLFVLASAVWRSKERFVLVYLGACLFAGGLIPSVGGYNGWYFEPFIFWTGIVAVFLALHLLWRATLAGSSHNYAAARGLAGFGALVALASVIAYGSSHARERSRLAAEPDFFFVEELGGYMHWTWREYVEMARQSEAVTVEEYWGIWSAMRRHVPILQTDAVIHALGDLRERTARLIREAPIDQLVTTRRSLPTDSWQSWSLSANWWFYGEALKSFVPFATSPATLLWRRDVTRHWPESECRISDDARSFVVDAKRQGLYEVELSYVLRQSPGRQLVMVRNRINYGAAAGGYLSLAPDGRSARFPVVVEGAGEASFPAEVWGPTDTTGLLYLLSCQARHVTTDHIEPVFLAEIIDPDYFRGEAVRSPFALTDQNWLNGVARDWAGFFTQDSPANRDLFKPGATVSFADGQVRRIERIEVNTPFLNVFLNGEPLDGSKVGAPATLEVSP